MKTSLNATNPRKKRQSFLKKITPPLKMPQTPPTPEKMPSLKSKSTSTILEKKILTLPLKQLFCKFQPLRPWRKI